MELEAVKYARMHDVAAYIDYDVDFISYKILLEYKGCVFRFNIKDDAIDSSIKMDILNSLIYKATDDIIQYRLEHPAPDRIELTYPID